MNIKSLWHKPERFTNYDPQSPAQKAARRWDEREGEIIEQNYNLRRITAGLMATIVLLGGALTYKCLSSSVVPYVLTYDASTGEIRGVGTAQEMRDYTPNQQVTEYFLRRFVEETRSVPLDPVVYKANLADAYSFVSKDGANLLKAQMDQEKLTEKFGKQTVQVNITNGLPMENTGSATSQSYQVRWTEDTFTIGSQSRTVASYTGRFTIENIHTDDPKQLEKNPAGLYVTDFHWERDNTPVNSNANPAAAKQTPAR